MSLSNIKYILCGYSGHAYVVLESAIKCGLNVVGYTELKNEILNPYELKNLGNEQETTFPYFDDQHSFILGIGDNQQREVAGERILLRNGKLAIVIHPDTIISKSVDVQHGAFVSAGVIVNGQSKIGKGVILNTGAIVEHGCFINNYSHIGPAAVLNGDVTVGTRSFIGANSVVKEGIHIGNNVMIGAGSVVLNDIQDGLTIVGNPGKVLLK